jgi:hypothetical protein
MTRTPIEGMKRFTLTPDELAAGGFLRPKDAAAQLGVTPTFVRMRDEVRGC